ncbi:MAG: hypothetical protein WCT52_00790 [Candidatus Micrarchaeia archaeon]
MSNAPVDTKGKEHHHGAHADDFLSQVRSLKEAEKSAQAVLDEAKGKAAQIEAGARERAVEMAARASEKSVAVKNEVLAKGREETDKEANGVINDAKKSAEKIRGKRLADKDVLALSQTVL